MKVVCNTIIIDFYKIDQLDLLKDVFDEVLIAYEVKEELTAGESDEIEDADVTTTIIFRYGKTSQCTIIRMYGIYPPPTNFSTFLKNYSSI